MYAKSVRLIILLICVEWGFTQKCSDVKLNERIACAPEHPDSKEVCAQRKCCFSDEKHNLTTNTEMFYTKRFHRI